MSQTIAGALVGGALNSFGSKVKIPDLPSIDPNAVQQQTISGNQNALPGAEQLASDVNSFNIKQQLAALTQTLNVLAPGQLQKVQGIVNSQLNGEVPTDVQAQLQRQSVAGAYGRGYGPGSQIASNDYLRNFGLTSMGIQQQGEQGFQALAGMGPKTPLFDVSSMFYSPQQRLQFAFQDRQAQYNVNLMKAQVAAAPDPAMAQLGQAFDNFFKTWESVGMGALGSMGGGAGGGSPAPGGVGGGLGAGAGSAPASSATNGTLGGWDNTGGGAAGFA